MEDDVSGNVAPSVAGFWARLGALLLDGLILSPLFALAIWSRRWGAIPALLLGITHYAVALTYRVAFNAIRGATPGKTLMRLRVTRADGLEMGWREAMLRSAVDAATGGLSWFAVAVALLSVTPAHYASAGFATVVSEAAPSWYAWVGRLPGLWLLADFAVLLLNDRRRAIHDYIAGTVVISRGRSVEPAHPTVSAHEG